MPAAWWFDRYPLGETDKQYLILRETAKRNSLIRLISFRLRGETLSSVAADFDRLDMARSNWGDVAATRRAIGQELDRWSRILDYGQDLSTH
jgi:hypothetical protein